MDIPDNIERVNAWESVVKKSRGQEIISENRFIEKLVTSGSFTDMVEQIRRSHLSDALRKHNKLDLFSSFHFLGEPTAKGLLFSESIKQGKSNGMRKILAHKKLISNENLVAFLLKQNDKSALNKIEVEPKINLELDQKMQKDPVLFNTENTFKIDKSSNSVDEKIANMLLNTPDYLNVHPNQVKNVLIGNQHLLDEITLKKILNGNYIFTLDEFIEEIEKSSATYFRIVITRNLPLVVFKMHCISLIMSKQYRASFGLGTLTIHHSVSHSYIIIILFQNTNQ